MNTSSFKVWASSIFKSYNYRWYSVEQVPIPVPVPEITDRLEQHIIKFGLPDTDMASHEYLSAELILSISVWLDQKIAPNIAAPIIH